VAIESPLNMTTVMADSYGRKKDANQSTLATATPCQVLDVGTRKGTEE